ncbi:hypothetical protein X777_03984 [Ooceraea biroi]|uniref:Uncharacterized protein n=1 Tax=Ooceraea biroi TaxID=2015173 RepID=A0A026WL26_OOCBI|nr:hypothetical protein X777_03984 [Ooceraea biroi]
MNTVQVWLNKCKKKISGLATDRSTDTPLLSMHYKFHSKIKGPTKITDRLELDIYRDMYNVVSNQS